MKKARPMAALVKSARRGQKSRPPSLPAGLAGTARQGNRAALVDAELRRLSTRIESDFFTVCELVQEVMDGHYHARYGFADAERYLEDRLGLSYRSVRRRLSVLEAVRTLPAKDQDDAKVQLAAVGSHKAAILAPALRKDPAGWRDWTKTAATEPVAALQARVSRALDAKPRGAAPDAPGARFLAYVLNQVPPETREEVAAVFEAGKLVAESDNAVQVFLCMVREVKVEWSHRAP